MILGSELHHSKLEPSMKNFQQETNERIQAMSEDAGLQGEARALRRSTMAAKYSYNFSWLGRPIIQYPQDIVAVQELIWRVRPDLVIETGIAHGGSLMLSASMLAMLDYCDAIEAGRTLDPRLSERRVIGIDIDIRKHNKEAIEAHPLGRRISMIEGSSVDPGVVEQVREMAKRCKCIMVFLDSNHAHEHVLAELEAYAPLVSRGSYCVVFDTIVEELPDELFPDRPWGRGNNPMTAVREYLRLTGDDGRTAMDGDPLRFEVDQLIEKKLLITVSPDGYLRRV